MIHHLEDSTVIPQQTTAQSGEPEVPPVVFVDVENPGVAICIGQTSVPEAPAVIATQAIPRADPDLPVAVLQQSRDDGIGQTVGCCVIDNTAFIELREPPLRPYPDLAGVVLHEGEYVVVSQAWLVP